MSQDSDNAEEPRRSNFDPSEWEPVGSEISEEELDRREREDDWVSYQDVLAHLKSLEQR